MTKKPLSDQSLDELVRAYEDIVVRQSKSLEHADTKSFGKEFFARQGIADELRSRDGDQRELLSRLFNHPKSWVRICVALDTFSLDPQRSRDAMQYVADHARDPFGAEARINLGLLDQGLRPK